jgi:hypothetical protein
MSNIGSLPNFLLGLSIFNESPQLITQSRPYESSESSFGSPRRKTMGSVEFRKLAAEKMTLEDRPEGYKYVSEHKDIENCIRVSSAAPTNRSIQKRPVTRSVYKSKPVTSRISCRRDPKETEMPVQKTVKMQEKIRNELL